MHHTQSINFDWKYTPGFQAEYVEADYDDSAWQTAHIPHTNIELPFNNFSNKAYQFESCYRKTITVTEWKADTLLFAHFEGVMAYARVFLNGIYLGEHKGGYTAFRINLTPALRANGPNILAVHVDSSERDDIPPFGHVVGYMTFGGIYREVSLEYRHRTHLESALVRPRNVLQNSPIIDLDLRFWQDPVGTNPADPAKLLCDIDLLLDGQTVRPLARDQAMDAASEALQRLSFSAGEIRLWEIDQPILYELRIRLRSPGDGDAIIGEYSYRFGFREVRFENNGFFLNGRKLKLRGLNRHQSFPYVGYAMPKSAQYRDAEILKYELGVNAVRSSHYPASRHFLDRCDELGLLVFSEIPGWQHIGEGAWQETLMLNLQEMILTEGNHPCIFIWGVRINESQDDDELYTRTNARARELDPGRPTGGVRCFAKSKLLEDVYTYNDFHHRGENEGLARPRSIMNTTAPYLITEHNGHMYPTKKYDDTAHLLSQAKRHLKVLDAMYSNESVAGAFGWCMFDYHAEYDMSSGDMISYHGVMDLFRIPKPAAIAYASQSDARRVFHVASSVTIGENEGSLLGDGYVFTNLDSVKMYKGERFVREFFPNRNGYPGLPHPPVIIDDFVGDALEKQERFSPRDARTIKELLIKVNQNGGELGIIDTLRMGVLFLKYRMNYQHGEDLYTKYFGGWGNAAESYTFEGWADGRCVERIVFDKDPTPTLELRFDATTLLEAETYDVTRCVVHLKDQNGNLLLQGHDAFRVSTEGPIEVIGPKLLALTGGSTGFWIKTTGGAGPAKVIVESERFGTRIHELMIQSTR